MTVYLSAVLKASKSQMFVRLVTAVWKKRIVMLSHVTAELEAACV